jgi:gluconate 2-dehydrogenase gamma chain
MSDTNLITRREALARTALLLGGTLAASTIAGAERAVWAATPGWRPRTLSAQESEMVATVAEHIIPTTDTPGGRAAGVHRLVDVLLTDYYSPAERNRFLAGLRAVNIRAIREHGTPFLRCAPHEQVELLTALDEEAYPPKQLLAQVTPQSGEAQRMRDSLSRAGGTTAGSVQPPSAAVDGMPEEIRRELRSGWFFRRLKELTLLGYYTSEIGATKELHVSPMGAYHGDVPFRTPGRAWA